jgi:hypothetical protein
MARLFGRAVESVTRSDRRKRELEFGSPLPPLTARPNRRRGLVDSWRREKSKKEAAPRVPALMVNLRCARRWVPCQCQPS